MTKGPVPSRFVVVVGVESFGPGRTSLELRADGLCFVINHRRGTERRFETRLDSTRARAVLEQAGDAAFWNARIGVKKGVADESRYRLELYLDDVRVHACDMWRSELESHRDAGALVNALHQIAGEVSGSAVGL
jgi:hypothetical protein